MPRLVEICAGKRKRDADSRGSASTGQTGLLPSGFPPFRNRPRPTPVASLMIKRFVSLVFLAVTPLLAQQPAEPFKAKVDVNLVLLDATGHCPNLSAPDETAAAIAAFVR